MWNPQPMRFRWMIFDADGTLFNYDRAEYYALRSTFLAFDYPFQDTYLQAYRHFNKLQWTAFEQGKLSLPTLKVRRFKCLLDELNIHTDPKAFSYAYLQHLSERHDLIDGAEALLKALAGQVGLVLMTNGIKEVQRSRLKLSSIGKYFSHIIISDEVGVAKPDRMIFEIAMEKMAETDKTSILMVGDNLSSDIKGGLDFGIQTCWYNPENKDNDPSIVPTFHITDLSEVLAIARSAS